MLFIRFMIALASAFLYNLGKAHGSVAFQLISWGCNHLSQIKWHGTQLERYSSPPFRTFRSQLTPLGLRCSLNNQPLAPTS
jgi:hypothetical protein